VRESLSYCLLVVALLAVCASCRTQRSEQANAVDQVSQATPQRIVSISPSVTEILYGVGAWPQVVAVSQFCSFPDDVKNKPRVGGWDNTNLPTVSSKSSGRAALSAAKRVNLYSSPTTQSSTRFGAAISSRHP